MKDAGNDVSRLLNALGCRNVRAALERIGSLTHRAERYSQQAYHTEKLHRLAARAMKMDFNEVSWFDIVGMLTNALYSIDLLVEELDKEARKDGDRNRQGDPNHSHLFPGVWDWSSDESRSGQPCTSCVAYENIRRVASREFGMSAPIDRMVKDAQSRRPSSPSIPPYSFEAIEPHLTEEERDKSSALTSLFEMAARMKASPTPEWCRGIEGLDHRWTASTLSSNQVCSKCGEVKPAEDK